MEKVKCKRCFKEIDSLEVFPQGLCLGCYEKDFNKEIEKTGKLPKPNFLNTINTKRKD